MAEAEVLAAPVPDAPTPIVAADSLAKSPPAPSVKDDNWRPQPQPIREDQVQTAVNFLSHPKVKDSPVRYRRTFLERKGLSREEIDEAFRRVPDPPFSTPAKSLGPHETTATQVTPPVQSYTAQQYHPTGQLALAPQERKQYRWTQMLLAVGLLASAGAGTGILVKNWLLPKLKSWIRHIARDEAAEKSKAVQTNDDEGTSGTNNLSSTTAVTTLAAAASEIALATQEMIRTRAEESEARKQFIKAMEAQTKEVRTAVAGMQEAYLDASRRSSPREFPGDKSMSAGDFNWTNRPASTSSWEAQYAARNLTAKSARSGPGTDFQKVVPNNGQTASQAPGRNTSVHGPHSQNYQEIIAMVKRGETPPGIRAVNDKPPNPEQLPSFPQLQPRQKPWEVATSVALRPPDGSIGQSGRSVGEKPSLENGTSAVHSSPVRSETSSPELWWRQQKVASAPKPYASNASRIIELDSGGDDEETVPSRSIGHGTFGPEVEARGNTLKKWVPPPIPASSLPDVAISQRIQGAGGSEQAESGYSTPDVKQEQADKFESETQGRSSVDTGSLQYVGVGSGSMAMSDGEAQPGARSEGEDGY